MAKKVSLFKNTYVIDMNKLRSHPIEWTPSGAILPIESKNGALPASPEDGYKLFAERQVRRMLEQYSILAPTVKKNEANTITEYLDLNGKPLITLYPNNDTYTHDINWQSGLSIAALEDLHAVYARQKRAMDGIAGALRQLHKK